MTNQLNRLAIAIGVVTLVIGLMAAPHHSRAQDPKPTVETVEVTDCLVRFFKRGSLATDRPGIIAEMPFDEGQTIAEGDLVVRLRDAEAVAALSLAAERAKSDTAVGMAEKEAQAAEIELESALRANQSSAGVVPGSVVERLSLINEARDMAITRAKEEVSLNKRAEEQAQAELDSFRIHSRQSGMVTRVFKREGEAVQQGESIIEVVDPTVARVEGKLHISQTRNLRVGMPVKVQLAFDDHDLPIEDEVFVGTLGFIDVSVSDIGSEVRIWAEVQNRNNILLDKLPAKMTIEVVEQ